MFLAARLLHRNTSPLAVGKATYFMSGLTQQLVCPYIVSGRSVAATRYTGLPDSGLQAKRERECMCEDTHSYNSR